MVHCYIGMLMTRHVNRLMWLSIGVRGCQCHSSKCVLAAAAAAAAAPLTAAPPSPNCEGGVGEGQGGGGDASSPSHCIMLPTPSPRASAPDTAATAARGCLLSPARSNSGCLPSTKAVSLLLTPTGFYLVRVASQPHIDTSHFRVDLQAEV
jgi:hypothetical protein